MTIAAVQLRNLRLRSSYIEISNLLRGRSAISPRQCYSPVQAPRQFHARAYLRQEEPSKRLPEFLEAYKRSGMWLSCAEKLGFSIVWEDRG